MPKKLLAVYLLALALCLPLCAQTLSVRDIMREPSLAGMRPDAERLSPDGRYVVFAWNPQNKEPRNLYLVSTDGGARRAFLVDAEANFEPRAAAPESKLNYGLAVRDEFARAREKSLGGVDISPDSRRILFSQNSDIYVLDPNAARAAPTDDLNRASIAAKWRQYEAMMTRRADLAPNLLDLLRRSGIAESGLAGQIGEARARLLNALNEPAQGSGGDRSAEQRQGILAANADFGRTLGRFKSLPGNHPQLQSAETFQKMLDELAGVENRLAVARNDYETAAGQPRRVTRTQGFEAGARWLTNDAILYASNGNWFVLNLRETSLVQVTREANPQAFVSVFNATPTEDGRLLAYVVSDGSRQRALFVPNYLDEYVQTPAVRRGWTEQKVLVAPTDGGRERPFEVKLPKAEGSGYVRGLRWAADHRSLIVDRLDQDLKRRQIFYVADVGSKAEQTILLTEERDEKWIAPLSRMIEPHPTDAARVLFASERDGFNHLYLAALERAAREPNPTGEQRQENPTETPFSANVKIEQMTRGPWEIDWAKWSNGDRVLFSSTQASTAEREFYHLLPATKTVQPLGATEKGMRTNPQIADPGGATTRFIYTFSRWNEPAEIFADASCNAKCERVAPARLTDSTPAAFKQIKWSEPRFVDVPTRDGKTVKSKVYLPASFDPKRKYPLVVFVHGAGYLQNTINGWNNYYREFMFNHLLTQKGYVVLDIDYRGSAGYGRDWRTDVFDFLGGKDYEDHLDAIDYAVRNYAVDQNKVGVYGGSYGGFMAGMLVLRAPDKIAAAAALRPVFDWKNYYAANPTYTAERLGIPERNAEAYRRSSPIAYAEQLRKPLLILHGMLDDNVHVQDSVQMIEKLMRAEKTQFFEAMLYPTENHAFQRPTSWADEYERIFWFFEKHLK